MIEKRIIIFLPSKQEEKKSTNQSFKKHNDLLMFLFTTNVPIDERQNIEHVNYKWLTSHEKSNCHIVCIQILYGKFVHVPLITRVKYI